MRELPPPLASEFARVGVSLDELEQDARASLREFLTSDPDLYNEAELQEQHPDDFAMGFDLTLTLAVLARLPDRAGTIAFAHALEAAAREHGSIFDDLGTPDA